MALEALILKHDVPGSSATERHVVNISIRGRNDADPTYDPTFMEVVDIPDQRHDGLKRVIDTQTGRLRRSTVIEQADRELVEETPTIRPTRVTATRIIGR